MHYPFEEGKAGELRDHHKTADASEYLLAARDVVDLARDTLSEEEYQEAEGLAERLTGSRRTRDAARARLVDLVKPPPKRPIYYAQHEMRFLPHWTRNTLRYLGDFVDMLVKSAVYEKTGRKSVFHSSFGPAIALFRQHWPDSDLLVDLLSRYNRLLYRDAKHDFGLPGDRKTHRFTAREVVLTAFVTMRLADRLTAISSAAKAARDDKEIAGL